MTHRRDELLAMIAAARTEAQAYIASGPVSWRSALDHAIAMLDNIEARVRREPTHDCSDYSDIRIGLYAVRNLEELDGGRLSLTLCRLDNALKCR